jgi:hypothetical protein
VKLRLRFFLVAIVCCGSALAQGAAPFTVSSPLEYQVFQRRTRLNGTILVRGNVLTTMRAEARVKGTSLEGSLPAKEKAKKGPPSTTKAAKKAA